MAYFDTTSLFGTTPEAMQREIFDQSQKRRVEQDLQLAKMTQGSGATYALLSNLNPVQYSDFNNDPRITQFRQQAAAAQQAMQGLQANDPESMRQVASKLMQMGMVDQANKLFTAANSFASNMSTPEKNLTYFEQRNNCGQFEQGTPEYEACRKDAFSQYLTYARSDTAANKMMGTAYDRINKDYATAETDRSNIQVANHAMELIDNGQLNVGSFGSARQGAERLYKTVLNSFGIEVDDDQSVQRTEELIATTGRLAGQLLSSGMFGAGTGISEKDLEFARQMVGNAQNLTPEGMVRILRLNAQIAAQRINKFNKRVDDMNPAFWLRTPEGSRDAFKVSVPELYQTKKVEPQIPAGAQRGTSADGTPVYLIKKDGFWKSYTMDGKPYEYKGAK